MPESLVLSMFSVGREAACPAASHEMARDEASHGKALKGLLERYFR